MVITPEGQRIRFLTERDGPEAAMAWVERTLAIYRNALKSRASRASEEHYRPQFEASVRAFEEWLTETRGSMKT